MMAAAVSDFRPVRVALGKVSRRPSLTLALRAVPDIVGRLPRRKGQVVVGFAVETGNVLARATEKLRAKRLDLLVAQRVSGHGAPFGRRPIQAWVISRDGSIMRLGRTTKAAVARLVVKRAEALWRDANSGRPHRMVRCGGVAKW